MSSSDIKSTNPPELFSLAKVRGWCLQNGLNRLSFLELYREAHLICISRLLHYILLEHLCDNCITIEYHPENQTIYIGLDTKLEIQISGQSPEIYFELIAPPRLCQAGNRNAILFSGAFLRILRNVLSSTPYADDFHVLDLDYRNSFFNLILNLALGKKISEPCSVIEPAYRGHGYYPFPALRIGPSIQDIVDVSHLSPQPVSLPLINVSGYRFHSTKYEDPEACAADWAGIKLANQACILPVHPWQLTLSPVIKEMLNKKLISVSPIMLDMIPLASQRTCRVLETNYDIKLSLNATITGEHRLLYRLNSHNAPFVSTIIRETHRLSEIKFIDFQYDIASMCWDNPLISNHLSAIIRAPCISKKDELVVPALNLWASVRKTFAILKLENRGEALETFNQYCKVIMSGPLLLCAEWGISLEPHMQNVYIVLLDGKPIRAIIRDLDSSIMNSKQIIPICRNHGIPLADDTWTHMPNYSSGQLRLIHAMLHGHLYQVMHFLLKYTNVKFCELDNCMNDNWQLVHDQAQTSSGRKNVQKIRTLVGSTKHSLSMRLRRSATMTF